MIFRNHTKGIHTLKLNCSKHPLFFMAAITIIILIIALISSCKKDDIDTSKNNWLIPMIKTETTNNNSTTYYYDKEGKIIKLENGDWQIVEFRYSPDSLDIKSTEIATNAVQKSSLKLNPNGMIASTSDGKTFTYDNKNRLIEALFPKKSNGWQNRITYHYNSNTGELDSTRQTERRLFQNIWKETTIYSYYSTIKETQGLENKGMAVWDKNQPHPLKHSETWSPISISPFKKITYTVDNHYSYDDQDRIVVMDHTEKRPDNTIAQWRTVYTYY